MAGASRRRSSFVRAAAISAIVAARAFADYADSGGREVMCLQPLPLQRLSEAK